jgi:hypothetical protein
VWERWVLSAEDGDPTAGLEASVREVLATGSWDMKNLKPAETVDAQSVRRSHEVIC